MNEQTRAMCFMAGANSVSMAANFVNYAKSGGGRDLQLFRKLGWIKQTVLAGDNEQQQRLRRRTC